MEEVGERNRRIGRKLRELREALNLSLRRAVVLINEEPGAEVTRTKLNLIERGMIDKLQLADVIRIGRALGMTTDDAMRLYGIDPDGSGEHLDPRLQRAIDLARRLPDDVREEMLRNISVITLVASEEMRRRVASQE